MRITQFMLPMLASLLLACGGPSPDDHKNEQAGDGTNSAKAQKVAQMNMVNDFHSYARPNEAKVIHLDWKATVDFNKREIAGSATYTIEKSEDAERIVFDVRELRIDSVVTNDGGAVSFELGPEDDYLGQPLNIPITSETESVTISYASAPGAEALLWVEGEDPFLFTQSQAILARTWLPCQDSPGIRFAYDAEVRVPDGLMALMSAQNPQETNDKNVYRFKMEQPIPSYLMALAVGDVEFRPIGELTGVYATPDVIEAAEYEFQEMDDMLKAAEELYGTYAWGRYDLLILPAAFPFGGMENPRLTFATPTIIAGDRSLTALVAHELAHSWSGNLVTNATWDDFWLNEGFTVYFEQRIMEAVYGREISEMLATLSYQSLEREVEEIMDTNPDDTHLKLHLKGRNPDDGMTAIAYDKGYFFLRMLEENIGREQFDEFLKTYFQTHAFEVMDTERFVEYLKENLLAEGQYEALKIEEWIYGPGLPTNTPAVQSDRIAAVDRAVDAWSKGELATSELAWNDWVYQERYRFLTRLPETITSQQLAELNEAHDVNSTGNNEVLFAWLQQALRHDYEPAFDRAEQFLIEVGRRKFLTPLYREMKETGKEDMAMRIYQKARPHYHAVSTNTMDDLLGYQPKGES